jgi:uncharacterized membrane protein YdjX (TVP38/TMEM64 family)
MTESLKSTNIMKNRLWIILFIAVLVISYFSFDLGRFLSLESLKASRDGLLQAFELHPWLTIFAFSAIYIIVTTLSLPGAAIMSLAGGAIFGLWIGLPVVLISASIGATLAFLAARYILRDAVQARFGDRLSSFNDGMQKDGAFYLFTLRLVPVFPFFLINLLMGLTPIKTGTISG